MLKKAKVVYVISFFAILVALILSFLGIIGSKLFEAVYLAAALNLLNFTSFIFSANYSIKKSNKTFLIFTMGGISIRLLFMLSLIFIIIKFLKVDQDGFIFALFIWYIFLLIFEIRIVITTITKSKMTKNVDL